VGVGRSGQTLGNGGLLMVVWSRIRTLTMSAFRTLLMHFRHAWTDPLIPHISNILFSYALTPVPLPFCPPTSKLEGKMQIVQEKIYEASCLGPNYLSSIPSDQQASALQQEDGDACLYRVVLKEGAVVREGVSIDNSERIKVLKVGTTVQVLETCISPEGATRFRIKDGWISERCHGGTEDLIVERVSQAMSDEILVERKDVIDITDMPDRGIKHRLHETPLRLMSPRDLFPDAAGWECDHCSVSFAPHEPAFLANLPSRNWLLCHNCFCSDPRAVAVAKGSVKPGVDDEIVQGGGGAPPLRDEDMSAAEAAAKIAADGIVRIDAEMKAPQTTESRIIRLATLQLAEMGFPEDQVRTAVLAAMPATGTSAMDSLETIIEQTIEILTTGMPPPVEDEEDVVDHEEEEEEEEEEEGHGNDEEKFRPQMPPLLSHSKSYCIAETKDPRESHSRGTTESFPTPEARDGAEALEHHPMLWRDADADKVLKINRLSRMTHFPRSTCRCALEMYSGDLNEARRWIEVHGMKYLPEGGRLLTMYPAVFVSLGLAGNVMRKSESQDMVRAEQHPELDGVEEGAIMQKLSARIGGNEADECLLYEGGGSKAEAAERQADDELVFEEAICDSLEIERASKVHKVIVALLCTRCQYLEFPGCSQHSQLLSVRKPNGHGKCARCSCATDLHSPWDKGCRICRKPTKKCFWAMTVRETQFLLRAFPSRSRTTNDDTCEVYVLHCPSCQVVGFPGVGGAQPSLCVRTKSGPFTVAATGEVLPPGTWDKSLMHVGACPGSGKPLEEMLVRVSFSEAKYLYKTAANVETYARYVIRAGGVRDGTLLAITDEEGPVNMLLGRLGTAHGGVMEREECLQGQVTVDLYDEERGLSIPQTVNTSQTRVVTHLYGHELGPDGLNAMRGVAVETDETLTSRYAREAIVWMISHWSPQHPPTLSSLGILNWQPFIQVFKLVGLSDRAFNHNTSDVELSMVLPSGSIDTLQSNVALASSVRSTSLAAVLKKQVIMWLRTVNGDEGGVHGGDYYGCVEANSLFQALLADSLQNLYTIALGETVSMAPALSAPPLRRAPLALSSSSAPLPPPQLLSRASSYTYDLNPTSSVAVRQSLHPFFGSCHYGEVVRIEGAQSLRVTLDARCAFGSKDEAALNFWRCEEDAREGRRPLKRFPSKVWSSSCTSFVVPNADSMYYSFEARGDRRQRLPTRLELDPTNFCRDDYSVENGVLRCTGGFPSVAPRDVVLTSGKWYYEVTLIKAGLAQLGWGDVMFTGNSLKGEGVGDDLHSWGLDGHRVFKWPGGGVRWGRAWAEGDVIGFTADLDKRTLGFSLNGSFQPPMGVAFEDVCLVEGLRPCMTLNKSCTFRVNFGEEPFRYAPPGFRPIIETPREHVLKKHYWGYRFEVASCMGLQTRPITDFKLMWKSRVSGGGTPGDVTSIWRPKIRPGCALLGDVAVSGAGKPEATLVVVDDDSPLLAYPTSFERVLTLDVPNEPGGSIWRPIPPEGYVALGDVFSLGYAEPPPSLVRCIRRDAVESAPLYRRIRVWKEPKPQEAVVADVPRVKNVTLWAVGNQCQTFVVMAGFRTPLSEGFEGRGWCITGAPPGTLHQSWQSEGEARDQPSMDWALWVLDCFLENCAATVLCENGGILSGQTYEALIKCIVDSHCTDSTRTPAASLLTRLLRTRRSHAHQPLVDVELPFSVRALGRVTHELLKFCREKLQTGRLFLQKDLQQIVELVTTINWVSPQSVAVQRAYSGSGDVTVSQPVTDAKVDLHSGKPHGGVLAQLKKAAKGERSTDEDALVDLMEMAEFFHAQTTARQQVRGGHLIR
jgi:hypothetical protein